MTNNVYAQQADELEAGRTSKLQDWDEHHEQLFADAVEAIQESLDDGEDFEHNLEHYSDLFMIDIEALRHEWNLRKGDCR